MRRRKHFTIDYVLQTYERAMRTSDKPIPAKKQEIEYNNIRRWERGFRIFPPLQFFVFSCLLYLFVLNFARCFGRDFEKYSCNLKFLLFYLLILKFTGAKTPVTFLFFVQKKILCFVQINLYLVSCSKNLLFIRKYVMIIL